jgi:hypothetical protein
VVAQRTLDPLAQVRILARQPVKKLPELLFEKKLRSRVPSGSLKGGKAALPDIPDMTNREGSFNKMTWSTSKNEKHLFRVRYATATRMPSGGLTASKNELAAS